MRRESKGISPIVAVIMLIAFTMIVAGILAGWATRFATEERQNLEKCVKASIIIRKATYDPTNQMLYVMLHNSGAVPLKGFSALVDFNNETRIPESWSINDTIASNGFQTSSKSPVDSDIKSVQIWSNECRGAFDVISSYDIAGL